MGTAMQVDRDSRVDREFWRGVLLAGGCTTVPRWTLDPVPGVAVHEERLPGDVVAALRRRAEELRVPLRTLLLAAHAKVLAALSGEREVVTGYVPGAGRPTLPCRLGTGSGSWRRLVLDASEAEAELRAHADFPVAELRRELHLTEPPFETLIDPTGVGAGLDPDAVLAVSTTVDGDSLLLRLRYRTEVLDKAFATRIAGYHATALALLAADPDAAHGAQSLLSPAEWHHQLVALAGPRRELPDRRFHELFDDQVARHPEAVAAVHRDRRWTYRELQGRANQLARALLARGLGREDVVAVVTDRDLDWLAAVLAVFKAGGCYLPIEPHFPPQRIATTLRRAGARLALATPGSTTMLDQALTGLPGVECVLIEDAYREGHPTDAPGVPVAADQLAYVYFTSGSTGEPKGAMCEHAGMLNHLQAKIDALGIGPGDVVAQTAPQCFDISLWQLVAGLLVGGRTLLVEQDTVLDVERFVDLVADGRVSVLQVVPSYLEVVLSYLEAHPRALPDLRAVSVTGEAVKKALTQRWFTAQPGVPLVNAYGLTETSDDTNHEVLHQPPAGDRVPIGRPVQNVGVLVVDEHLRPVPLGAPGELVFTGVCVGRGYLNDPDRTRQAFGPDPHHPGGRLYRAGDYGRWLPEGSMEFLGRRDAQVKIAGFRIEIGEVENALLGVPGIRDGAVVVADRGAAGRQLVAFYAGPQPVDPDLLRDQLARTLPRYMVPAAFHWRPTLPLTPNSKIDRKALTALTTTLTDPATDPATTGVDAPRTPTEQRLAAAWATVLGTTPGEINRTDSFFDRGGTSLTAVKLAITLDRAVSLPDLVTHPVLADLAALVDGRSQGGPGLAPPRSGPDTTQAGGPTCRPAPAVPR